MKKKRTFTFHCMLDPCHFLARIQEEAKQAHLPFEQSENAFKVRIEANHGGQVFYQAHIYVDEDGGSLVEGEVITVPWCEDKTKFQKVIGVIGYILGGIVLSPIIILLLLILGFDAFFSLFKRKGKRALPWEKHLLDFMINKMSCEQK